MVNVALSVSQEFDGLEKLGKGLRFVSDGEFIILRRIISIEEAVNYLVRECQIFCV